ncbi:Sugar transferase involved in LPS biosynthesis (colanic, teichoic acid) [Alteromonadaceae bacterium Bs31]|nr:Sugar transferase involved in LPS biosynthesis (colanic, teichoic acid) [Alteromonadaceae bacterium Bs31]
MQTLPNSPWHLVHNLIFNSYILHADFSFKRTSESLQKVLVTFGFLCALPLLALVYCVLRLESRGNPIYKQQRIGLHGREFTTYKFRSMYIPSDPRFIDVSTLQSDREGICKKLKKDPRITPIGRFIRKYSIDELPQLWNIVKGDMVLVGPRPALPEEVAQYNELAKKRLSVMPGLTGLWQISGRADTSFEEQINLDLRYIQKKSLLSDLIIIFHTPATVLSARGAY